MAKIKTQYVCNECGGTAAKWQGQCSSCGEWNTLIESTIEPKSTNRFASLAADSKVQLIDDVEISEGERANTGSEEFDRVLGGGLTVGSVVLIGGDPGIGKSTLLLQALVHMATDSSVLYVSGEESAGQSRLARND
jgi:DNA repair protein RadA/Sms